MAKIDFYYVLTGYKISSKEKVYYAIDHHSGGYPFWSTMFESAKRFKHLSNVDKIGETDFMRKEITEMSIEEISVFTRTVSTEEIISEARAKMLAEIDELQQKLKRKTEALQSMI